MINEFHLTTIYNTCFSSAHKPFAKINQVEHESSLNKFESFYIINLMK